MAVFALNSLPPYGRKNIDPNQVLGEHDERIRWVYSSGQHCKPPSLTSIVFPEPAFCRALALRQVNGDAGHVRPLVEG
ncbi:MAG: hypothetical protein ABL901_09230, partial [Hyphomicrobiaceae bacterium]